MFEDTATLIRVVRTLGCNLSVEELSFDPTVRVLTDLETQRLTGNAECPSVMESSGGNDSCQWCTIGLRFGRLFHFWVVVPTSGGSANMLMFMRICTYERTR
jgi:hypothetical protein